MPREPLAVGIAGSEYKLTERKARFANLLAKGQSPPIAARACGYSRSSALGHSHKLAKDERILRYINYLKGEIVKKVNTSGILSLSASLRVLSAQAQAHLGSLIRPDGQLDIEAIRRAKPGTLRKYRAPNTRTGESASVEIVDPAAAARALVQFYSDESRGEDESFAHRRQLTVNVLVNGNPAAAAMLDKLAQQLASADALPIEAKVLTDKSLAATDPEGEVALQPCDPPVTD
jgi:hypothetical protein